MSTRSPVTRNDGTNWNSICVTSGAPLPALSAVRHSRRRVRLLVPFISPSPIVRDPWLFHSLEQASVPAAERELLALWDLAAVVQVPHGLRDGDRRGLP